MAYKNLCNLSFLRIGEILLKKELITEAQLATILRVQKQDNRLFGEIAVSLGFITEDILIRELSEIFLVDIVSLEFFYIPKETLNTIDFETANECKAVPFFVNDSVAKIAISDPGEIRLLDRIRAHYEGKKVEFSIAKTSEILRFLEIMKDDSVAIQQDPLLLLNKIIFEALEHKASDIHFEPQENSVRVRFRIDGVLNVITSIDAEFWPRISSKLKIMAQLNIVENRKPQSGHTKLCLAGRNIDLRISTHPGVYGENFVVRIFDLSEGVSSLPELGFFHDDYLWLKKICSSPNGLFLIVGPTGSGKTTTLYSILKEINSSAVNIMTLEDPIEHQIDGIKQMELREEGILTFSDGVRSILRQDPDVLLIGEIRDENTAAMAIRAALTGRLVLATLHAATPLEGLRRMLDFGLKFQDFIPVLLGIFSQRLVRYLVREKTKNEEYKGRFPLTEYIYFSQEMKELLLTKGDLSAFKLNKSFADSCSTALEKKLTDRREIERVFGDDFI